MGCTGCLRLWRRRNSPTAQEVEVEHTESPRPYHGETGILGDEKVPIPMGRIAQPAPIKVRTDVNPHYSAYSTPVDFKSKDELDFDARRFRGPPRRGTFDSLDTPVSTVSPLTPSTPEYVRMSSKWKDEGVEDPEEERRRRKAEEAKRKAEQEEQERLDFFQML